ncbi:hypothetical protein [Streptomyces albidoflavus]|uniref:hypothetical protein n=1 Tax=Streptomyces albidoflavus TaxID=1886 RepID=UPI000FF75550|nr:hypothetical protein [Streptomyces albidoflavus]RWZ73244.1 hypothetical protein EQK42_25385 [Streptomyces albidoflavus]
MARRTACAGTLTVLALVLTGCGAGQAGGEKGDARPGRSPAPEGAPAAFRLDHVGDRDGRLTDLAALGPDELWASGYDEKNGEVTARYLLRDTGDGWRRLALPDTLADLPYPPRLDAAGPGTLWATGATAEQNGTPVIARYQDGRWSTLTPPPGGSLLDLVAFGPDDVTLLQDPHLPDQDDGAGNITSDDRSRAAHWDGTRWTTTLLPSAATALDGTSGDDLWAVGHRSKGPGTGGEGQEMTQTAAHHFDGSRWKTVETPLRRFADPVPPEAGAALGTVIAVAPDEVYAYGRHSFNHGEVEDEPDDEELRLRWDGKRWRDLPGAEGACGTRPPLLVDGDTGTLHENLWYQATDGPCYKVRRPELPAGGEVRKGARQGLALAEVAVVPGTDRMVGVGHIAVMQSGNPFSRPVTVHAAR